MADAFRPVKSHLPHNDARLRSFIDAQLLISAQATSAKANALYSAAALDLPRRGAVHIRGGMGAISTRLVDAVRTHGGRVLMRKRVNRVLQTDSNTFHIEVQRDAPQEAEIVILNLPPWNIRNLLEPPYPRVLEKLSPTPDRGWGAFMIYLGVSAEAIPPDFPLHHQIIEDDSLAEGDSIFLSINPEWDDQRAPVGKRTITISTHTGLAQWWQIEDQESQAYQEKRGRLREKILKSVERILPGIQQHAELIMDGTPQTFAYFTGRERGWVGGFPQTDLFQGLAPHLARNIWMVGDSIFPGQSTAAVALGGLRVAYSVLLNAEQGRK
jgi:phytoene dehydrogenase-like protein